MKYTERLPQLISFSDIYNYDLGDKNDILLNYFILKLKKNEKRFISTLEELVFVKIYEVKKIKNSL